MKLCAHLLYLAPACRPSSAASAALLQCWIYTDRTRFQDPTWDALKMAERCKITVVFQMLEAIAAREATQVT